MNRSARTSSVLFLLATSIQLGGVAHAQTTITAEDYVARLRSSLTSLRQIPPASAGTASIEAALAPIGLPVDVRMTDGTVVEITRDSLVGDAAATGDDSAPRTVSGRIAAALDAATAAIVAGAPDRAEIDAAIAAAYEGLEAQPPSLTSRALAYVGQVLGWLIDHTVGAAARSGFGGLLGLLLLLVLLAGGAAIMVRAGRSTVADARWSSAPAGEAAVDWRRVADEALARGDLRETVRALYHALLVALAARGVVRDDPSLTAGECRTAVRRARPSLAPEVDRATGAFERVVYGKRPARDEDVASLRRAETAVRRS